MICRAGGKGVRMAKGDDRASRGMAGTVTATEETPDSAG